MPTNSQDAVMDNTLEALIRECFEGRIAPSVAMTLDTDLTSYGLDSFTVVRLIVELEEQFEIRIPDSEVDFDLFARPRELWQMVTRMRDSPLG